MKVAALSKELEQKNELINAQREELFELKITVPFMEGENEGLKAKNNSLKDEVLHHRCERAEAITALVEIINTYPKKSTDLFRVKDIARKALKGFNHFTQD